MITDREQQIIDLYEAKVSQSQIAARLGLAPSYVRGRISYLCSGLGIDRVHEQAMIKGSRALKEAIERVRAGQTPAEIDDEDRSYAIAMAVSSERLLTWPSPASAC